MTPKEKNITCTMMMSLDFSRCAYFAWLLHIAYCIKQLRFLKTNISENTQECQHHEAEPSRGTKTRRDEEQTRTTHKRLYETTDTQRKRQQARNRLETVCLKTIGGQGRH